ncbi:MAG TPA: cytochrome P450 [Ktedonobacterales bacterium]
MFESLASPTASHLPPGRFGPPVIGRAIGQTLPLVRNTRAFLTEQRARYGEVVHIGFMGENGAVNAAIVFGREAQAEVLRDNERFPAAPGYAFSKPTLGNSLLSSDGDLHTRQRKVIAPAFSSKLFGAFVERVEEAAQTVFAAWGKKGKRVFYTDAQEIMFRLACRIILGVNDEEYASSYQETLAKWETLQQGVTNPIHLERLPVVRWPLPWHRQMEAARWLDAQVLEREQMGTADPNSVLGILMAERARRYAEGGITAVDAEEEDNRIAQHLRLILFAAYGTTAGTVSRILLELYRRPDTWAQRVSTELGVGRIGEPVTLAQVREEATPETNLFLRECLRMYPGQHLIVRGCTQHWQVHGHTIPAGWVVIIPALLNHRNPEAFPNPDVFDPDRFRDPTPELREKQQQALAIFGGGAHACPGQHLAQVEIKAILARLLRDFDVQLLTQDMEAQIFDPAGRPKSGTRIAYRRVA